MSHLSDIYRIFATVVTVAVILLVFPLDNHAVHYTYTIGSYWANDDLWAPFNFEVQRSVDEQQRQQAAVRQESMLFFTIDSTAYKQALTNLDTVQLKWQEKRLTRLLLQAVYRQGYIEIPPDCNDLSSHTLVVLEGNVGSEHTAADFITPDQIEELVARFGLGSEADNSQHQVAALLRQHVLVPSVHFEATRTQLELDSRLSQLAYSSEMIKKGDLIVAKGDYISAEVAQKVNALEEQLRSRGEDNYNVFNHMLGLGILCLVAFSALFLFLRVTDHAILKSNRSLNLMLLLIMLVSAMVAIIERVAPAWILAAPLCILPILMMVFFDRRVALYVHLTVVIILANVVPNSYEFIFYQVIAGMMTLVSVKNFDHSHSFFRASIIIFFTYSIIYTAGVLAQDTHLYNITWSRYLVFVINAMLTLLALPLVYLFEKLFGLTTSLTLFELSSANTPLLRQLSQKAPGTFQHSMQVANISEDLISEIGGNSLLARVGALYHDIGKMNDPLFFTENQQAGFNPHDNLDPEESAHIIIRHVTDGLALARKYHLPNTIADFIRTHHGTTTTGYFYAKWCNTHPGQEPDTEAFRYKGPIPFSRETAAVMIVDSVEAASKSLHEPTHEEVEKLVNNIIDAKISEHQLDNCNLTFSDVANIRHFLTQKIISIYHVRVAYPVMNQQQNHK